MTADSPVVSSGQTVSGQDVLSGSVQTIVFGGIAVSGTVSLLGSQTVFGRTSGMAIGIDGDQIVSSGGVAYGTVVSAGGIVEVEANGRTSGGFVLGSGAEFVVEGGVAV